ncbi:hypothetical protein C8J98_102161 [Luteibacter sp. OK325]|uniref:hypothetical protein n=1 Tax=Luteibacter sp. OK325 TaxID=2135670 RepID=UPI000D3D1D0B|nr:hypothetical protein [Luteibacter sp. OK325]PTR33974.1 hypothetical protein C8J98_102161 [Luteibacter sp. OK325]
MIAKYRLLPAALALIGACALACASAVAAHDSDDRDDSSDLAGTWQFQITLHNCQSGAPVGAPFQSLLTFADGGTMTETTANSMFYPAERGPGHGVWSRGRHKGQYSAASIAFITMNGGLVKTQKITQTIQMGPGPNKLSTPQATVEFFDPAGNLLQTGCAVAVAERFEQ